MPKRLIEQWIEQWIATWIDLVDFEVVPVITSAQAAERIRPRR